MLTKEKLLDSIKDFPAEFSIDKLVERLFFVQKVENGVAQGERDEVYTTEQLRGKLTKWLRQGEQVPPAIGL